MEEEYLIGYGLLGDFGRFRTARPLHCERGDAVVVLSVRGLELGHVLCPATPRHAHFLPNTTVGTLLRPATPEDDRAAERLSERGRDVFEEARRRAEELGLPLEIIDAEVLLGEHAVLHFVRWDECDLRELVSGLSRQFSLHVLLEDLTRPAVPVSAEAEHGCGSCGSGGCGSGGCESCGSKTEDARVHFAELREQMVRHNRTPLL